MRPLLTKPMLGLLSMLLLGLTSRAQDKEEGESQVKVKITREINGEKQTYEGTYNSEKEMQADPKLKEFMGEDDQMNFWFGDAGPGVFDFDTDDEASQFFFHFDDDEGKAFHFPMLHPDDSAMKAFEFQVQKMAEEMGKMDFDMADDADKQHHSFGLTVKKNVRISEDPGKEFGKKGAVKKNDLLILDDLSYFPNPSSNGRFRLKFTTPSEGELSIRVYNLDGKEIFGRYFGRFNGLYSETIDLNGQEEGMYLLEIQQEGYRLTRKIVID